MAEVLRAAAESSKKRFEEQGGGDLGDRATRAALATVHDALTYAFNGNEKAGMAALGQSSRFIESVTHTEGHNDAAALVMKTIRKWTEEQGVQHGIGGGAKGGGRRSRESEEALVALAAALGGDVEMCKQVGITAAIAARGLIASGEQEGPYRGAPARATPGTLRTKAVKAAILAWCHNDDVWRPDSNGYTVSVGGQRIRHRWTGRAKHPLRFFRSNSIDEQLKEFKESEEWKAVIRVYPDAHVAESK
jgi:hypothetical protein